MSLPSDEEKAAFEFVLDALEKAEAFALAVGYWELRDKTSAAAAKLYEVRAQGFAQGAAAQLAEKPTCWVTPDGEGFRMRLSPPVNAVPLGWQELYTRREAK